MSKFSPVANVKIDVSKFDLDTLGCLFNSVVVYIMVGKFGASVPWPQRENESRMSRVMSNLWDRHLKKDLAVRVFKFLIEHMTPQETIRVVCNDDLPDARCKELAQLLWREWDSIPGASVYTDIVGASIKRLADQKAAEEKRRASAELAMRNRAKREKDRERNELKQTAKKLGYTLVKRVSPKK